MKLSVIYDSRTGNTEAAAFAIAEGMREVEGTEVRTFHMKEVDTAFVRESTGVVFGTPTYVAGPTADFYSWFEKDSKELGLAGKLGGAFATGQYIHGGEDIAINTILIHLMVKGMMTYSGGAACGKPVIHLGPVAISPDKEGFRDLFRIYGKRFVEQAAKIRV